MILLLSFSTKIWGANSEYPKIIVYKGDTLVLITLGQVDSLNITYTIVDEYKELSDSLKSSVAGYELVIIKDKEIIRELREKNEIHDQIVEQKNIVNEELKKDNKKLKKKNKLLKFFNGVLMVTTTILGVVVAILSL